MGHDIRLGRREAPTANSPARQGGVSAAPETQEARRAGTLPALPRSFAVIARTAGGCHPGVPALRASGDLGVPVSPRPDGQGY